MQIVKLLNWMALRFGGMRKAEVKIQYMIGVKDFHIFQAEHC